jgi:hypothetical protein
MRNMWDSLGFKNSPYNATPLSPTQDDIELLVGRDEEAVELCTSLESAQQGVFAISGVPGVGKTSFLNVQQYLLESQISSFGPHLMAARQLCPIQPSDSPRDVAYRAVYSFVRSIEEYCTTSGMTVPRQTSQIGKWINARGGGGFDIGLQILGCGGSFGRNTELPSVRDVSFEGLRDALHCLVSEVVAELGFSGAFLVLDNIENLADEQLNDLLISFRDSLFEVPCIWWVLIGQSGLGSLIQALDPRVSERMTGASLELDPISLDELNHAIDLRVQRFHSHPSGKSPLTRGVHEHLYRASHGEIRFVFKYSNTICIKLVTDIRQEMLILVRKKGEEFSSKLLDGALGRVMVDHQLPEQRAEEALKAIISQDVEGLNLKQREKRILKQIGEKNGARPKDYRDFGCDSTQQFYSRFIGPFHRQHLLLREQEGKAVTYKLRGVALLASEFGLLEPTR